MSDPARRSLPGLCLLALVLSGCGRGEEGPGTWELPFDQWAADTMTLEAARGIVEAVGQDALFDRISLPSPVLTDFFGVQILRPVPPEQVRLDLVPFYADVAGETPYALTLRFQQGPEVVFRFNTLFYLDGNPMDIPYARVELANPEVYPRQAEAFRQILVNAGLSDRYLEPNRYFLEEQVAWDRMLEPERLASVTVRTDTAVFGEVDHGVLLVGETHGGTDAFESVVDLVLNPATDWLALEMLPEDLQTLLDRYQNSVEGSEAWQDAREALLRYYSRHWNTRGQEVTEDPVDNPYFRLIDLARSNGKPVVALDTSERYVTFRYGEFPLGAATRDYVWASKVPDWGRGVIYGGSSHFSPDRRPNMLTFLQERFPEIEVFQAPGGG